MKMFLSRKKDPQRGLALVLAIGFLAVLSILGAVVLNVSTSGLKETGLDLPRQRVFYAADRTVDYALNQNILDQLFAMSSGGTPPYVIDLTATAHKDAILDDDASNGVTLDYGTVRDFAGTADVSLPNYIQEMFGINAKGNLYHVNVKTTVNKDTPIEQSVHIDSGVLRVWLSQDEQIFITGGKG